MRSKTQCTGECPAGTSLFRPAAAPVPCAYDPGDRMHTYALSPARTRSICAAVDLELESVVKL
jgi:hypothetical protein